MDSNSINQDQRIKQPPTSKSGWIIPLGTVKGIPIQLHLSFILLVAWIALGAIEAGRDPVREVFFLIAVFASITIHELSHALTAKMYGIRTRDIILYPFGGIAALLDHAKPKSELLIALAGPVSNFVIAFLSYLLLKNPPMEFSPSAIHFLHRFLFANMILALFNLLPAFPMDGGRILRATLQLLGIKSATRISSSLSQFFCLLLFAAGIYYANVLLIIIAIIVFANALHEQVQERAESVGSHLNVTDLTVPLDKLDTLTHGTTVQEAVQKTLKSSQSAFPVIHGKEPIGVIEKHTLLKASHIEEEDAYVSSIMDRDFLRIHGNTRIADCIQQYGLKGGAPFMVFVDEQFTGMLFREQLFEIMMADKKNDQES